MALAMGEYGYQFHCYAYETDGPSNIVQNSKDNDFANDAPWKIDLNFMLPIENPVMEILVVGEEFSKELKDYFKGNSSGINLSYIIQILKQKPERTLVGFYAVWTGVYGNWKIVREEFPQQCKKLKFSLIHLHMAAPPLAGLSQQ